jgi:hypothetical protein
MDLKRRFVFHGHASALGGRIVRPSEAVLEAPGSALPVTGGRSAVKIPGAKFGRYVSFGSASTFAEGLFDDLRAAAAVNERGGDVDVLTTTTIVRAEVREIVVGLKPQLKVKRLRAALTSRSPAASNHPAIKVDEDTVIEGVTIDRHKLIVEFNETFRTFDTYAKLLGAADDPKFVRQEGGALLLSTELPGRRPPPAGRIVESAGVIYGTIVRQVRWDGPPFPGAVIDHHTVVVPEFGTIFFGELLIEQRSRRLTAMRLELGSPDGGSGGFGDVQDNGMWYP